jgi:hypothetical protein
MFRLSFTFMALVVLVTAIACSESRAFHAPVLVQPDSPRALPLADQSDVIVCLIASAATDEQRKGGEDSGQVKSKDDPGSPEQKGAAADAKADEVLGFKERIIEFQNSGKLGFRKVVACSSVEGFGIYSPLQVGQSIGKTILYFEPSNVSTLVSGDRYIIDCTVDLFVVDSSGKSLGGKENILRINRVSRSPILDLYYKVEMNINQPMKGDVFVKTVLRDKIKNQTVSATYKISPESGAKKLPHASTSKALLIP